MSINQIRQAPVIQQVLGITIKDWGSFWSATATVKGKIRVGYGKKEADAQCELHSILEKELIEKRCQERIHR